MSNETLRTAKVEFTFREFRRVVSADLGRSVSRSTLYYWVNKVCFWVGLKDFYGPEDLEWILYWEDFRTTRSRSVKAFHDHVIRTFGE